MKKINPIELFLWTFRRKEKDVVNLYDSLSDLMRLATGGDMLNFGYWDDETKSALEAQKKMCTIFGKKALLESNQHIVDVGSGISSPAIQWYQEYSPVKLSCININFTQLLTSMNNVNKSIPNTDESFNLVNATATTLPFESESIDRVLSLEAAQHFKPLKNFDTMGGHGRAHIAGGRTSRVGRWGWAWAQFQISRAGAGAKNDACVHH